MSRGLETGGRLAARCRSPPAPDPREASREARLGGPATLGRLRAARSALEGPTAPRPLGREKPRPARAADAHSTRSPSSSCGAPASGAGQPASLLPPPGGWGRTRRRAVSAAPPGCAAKAEGRQNGTAPASGTGAPGSLRADPRADPRPRRLPVQAATIQPAPHLISRRIRAAAPGTNQWSSLAEGRDAGAATPHTIPARPPLREPRSPLGILPREPPYYGATKLRSLPFPPLFSTSFAPSLAPSLPPISSSPSATSPATTHRSLSAHKWVGTSSLPIERRGLNLLTAPYR